RIPTGGNNINIAVDLDFVVSERRESNPRSQLGKVAEVGIRAPLSSAFPQVGRVAASKRVTVIYRCLPSV
nr:hypothetical protein [Actinomycetota bacterium]